MALVGEGGRRSATVAALEEAESMAVYREEFEQLCRQHPSVDRMLFAFLADEVRSLTSGSWRRSTSPSRSGSCVAC